MKKLSYYFATDGYILIQAGLNFKIENLLKRLDSKGVVHEHIPIRNYAIEGSIKYLLPIIDIDAGFAFRGAGQLLYLERRRWSSIGICNMFYF